MFARMYLGLSVLVAATAATGCLAPTDEATEESTTAATLQAEVAPAAPSAEAAALEDPGAGCKSHFEYTLTDANRAQASSFQPAAATCTVDIYFHPSNGAPGGWIEAWRLCDQGGGVFQICTGGYAPVRPYNPSSCGGTVYNSYPQGWHGTAQTFGGCC